VQQHAAASLAQAEDGNNSWQILQLNGASSRLACVRPPELVAHRSHDSVISP
jgi:hypothetical protein